MNTKQRIDLTDMIRGENTKSFYDEFVMRKKNY